LQINLIPANGIQVSIYSPTGKNNLFEDSSTGQWSGQLPESGYYEIILINPSKTAIPYTLKIN
jgi:serine/threonine-protein kinase